MGVGLILSVEVINRQRLTSLRKKGSSQLMAFRFKLQQQLFPGSPASQPTLQTLDLQIPFIITRASSLKEISQYAHPIGSVSPENPKKTLILKICTFYYMLNLL